MNKFSIFHTSLCGSTLLATMLSKSIDTYSEPHWSHQITHKNTTKDAENFVLNNHLDNTLVKYSSVYCYASPLLPYKKVFLYRKLKQHLQKSLLYGNGTVKFNFDVMMSRLHPNLNHVSISGSLLQISAYLWVDRLMWMKESSDVLWIDSDDFFDDTKGAAENVCNHFGIPYVLLNVPFHAKEAGFNHTDSPINVNEMEHHKRKIINPTDGKIIDFENSNQINEIIEKTYELFPVIEKKYIE
jgi:hypothetical protein